MSNTEQEHSNYLDGVLHKSSEIQPISAKFAKRELVLKLPTNSPEYPSYVILELHKKGVVDHLDIVDRYNIGDKIRVYFNVSGREHNSKYYNTLQAWRIQPLEAAPNLAAPVAPATQSFDAASFGDDDDLPF